MKKAGAMLIRPIAADELGRVAAPASSCAVGDGH
jgi:hypothetical protein